MTVSVEWWPRKPNCGSLNIEQKLNWRQWHYTIVLWNLAGIVHRVERSVLLVKEKDPAERKRLEVGEKKKTDEVRF